MIGQPAVAAICTAFGIVCGWTLARPEDLIAAWRWCRRRWSDLLNLLPGGGEIRVSGYGPRPPTPAEVASHRLGIVDGLHDAGQILAGMIDSGRYDDCGTWALRKGWERIEEQMIVRRHALDHGVEDRL